MTLPTAAPGRAHRITEALVAVVVLLILAAAAVIVVVAMRAAPGAQRSSAIVFTVVAPYRAAGPEPVADVRPQVREPAPVGDWTPARGRQIAERALSWLNWPYSWDAGNADGPTYGRAVDYDSRNDANVRGFDCSGLVLYALAPWMRVDHSAAAQYAEAGTVHPALDELVPGDLVFWSKDGTVGGIGHVAIYVGNGDVVQAPHSGAYVDVVPLDRVEPGRIGTTRPLS